MTFKEAIMSIRILTENEIRKSVSLDSEALEAIAEGFTMLADENVVLLPILRIDVPENDGEVDIKTAYIKGMDSFAVKIAAGFLGNYKLDLPTGSGMMVLLSTETGRPMAVLLDNGYLTDVRTGLAGALAAKYLAPEKITNAGVIGSGAQARYQIRGLNLVRDFERLLVFGIEPDQVEQYVEEMTNELGMEVIAKESAEEVVRESDIVVTTTPSKAPYLKSDWLHPGLHITCMGSDSEEKQEIHADAFVHVDRIVCDVKSQCFRLGELHHALEGGFLSEEKSVIELGELTSGRKPGRQNSSEITICDLTGVGVQDTQIARYAYQRAVNQNLGLKVDR
jgi:ornithine cyclodeaminase